MKREKNKLGWIFVLLTVFFLLSCDLVNENTGGIDFDPHSTDYSILVRNNTNQRLIAFKGDLRADTLIGGIPARAQNHGLPYNPALFDKTEDFPMILITEEQYNANKANLSSLRNTPFTRVYVFYNRNGDNTAVYEIAAGLGGNNRLRIINNSNSINVELRLGGIAGETIGYAPAGILETTIRMQDGDYEIFPVFKRYNSARDVVGTVFPKMVVDGASWRRSYNFENNNEVVMDLKELLGSLSFSSGAAWVVITNQTTSGGIRFFEGSNPRKTPSGMEIINNGHDITFQIDMDSVGNNTYSPDKRFHNWHFGPLGYTTYLEPTEGVLIECDKMYTITVTGDYTKAPLMVSISEGIPISAEDLGVQW